MFKLNRSGEYAIRAALYLASNTSGKSISVSDIARMEDVPVEFLRKIAQALIKGKIVRSRRGVNGGIVLSRPAEQISLLEVIEAAEGPIYLNTCLVEPDECRRSPWCAIHVVWCQAQMKFKNVLAAKTLAELAAANTERFEYFAAKCAAQSADISQPAA